MSLLCNLTRYGAVTLPSMGRDGRDLVLAVTAARYRLPKPIDPPEQPLVLDEEQCPPPLADIYCGPPEKSGLRIEGQAAFARPATDITVSGHACALHDEPVTSLKVNVIVGPCSQQALVYGERIWDFGLGLRLLRMSQPQPFIKIPLVWERAFGGCVHGDGGELIANEPSNPVGRGLFRNREAACGQLLANVENPRSLIQGPQDRPAPIGFGPVARWWQPRIRYAGTYDDKWQRDQAPVWPENFDERFFCAAPTPLQAVPHLRGGEPVFLEGLHRDGTMRFRLPAPQMAVRFRFNGRDIRKSMVLDAVIIEPDTGHLTLIHRAMASAMPNISAHRETVIRNVEAWEASLA